MASKPMGRAGKLGNKMNTKRRVRSKDKGSDSSDEDYMVGDDEACNESDDYCSSFSQDISEESLSEFAEEEFEEEEEEEEEVKVRKVVRSQGRKSFSDRQENCVEKTRKKKKISYNEEDDEDYDDDDEEFMPDEIDSVDDEDELAVKKKNRKVGRPCLQEKGLVRGQKRKRKKQRNSKVMKKTIRKKPAKKHRLGKKSNSRNDGHLTNKNLVVKERNKNNFRRKARLKAHSDSDFMSSESSDYDYTISEEEKEQVREASELCRSLATRLASSNRSEDKSLLSQERKHLGRKGKEKVEDLKTDIGKHVCGICFSEEGKKTVRGTINCCSHFFCFACIMEWSKVESRCPLCKQRFVTISKPARSNTGFDLRTVVTRVPERDQIYQPSEEELRLLLDPYENVICTECQQGGDDALMLLCDLCDSPAHTYCVGLGHEVPEDNWYCEGCRPTAFVASTPQASNPTPDQRTSYNFPGDSPPVDAAGESLDPTLMCVPETPLAQGTGLFSSPRCPAGDFQAAFLSSGAGAYTVSERRRVHLRITDLINIINQSGDKTNGISARLPVDNAFGSEGVSSEVECRNAVTWERVSSQNNATHLVLNQDLFPARFSHSRGQILQRPNSTATDNSANGMRWADFGGINTGTHLRVANEQIIPCSSRSNAVSDTSVPPCKHERLLYL